MCVPLSHARIDLTSSSLKPILLSRFIINLRQASDSSACISDNRCASHLSVLNFRMPAPKGAIDNLGESMDFGEHRVDCGSHEEALDEYEDSLYGAGVNKAAGCWGVIHHNI